MTRIKICGLYRPEDIEYVNEVQPNRCGFITHVSRSHRSRAADRAAMLREMREAWE